MLEFSLYYYRLLDHFDKNLVMSNAPVSTETIRTKIGR